MSGRERPSRAKQPNQQERSTELPSRSTQQTGQSTSKVESAATSAIYAARGLTVGLARSARDLIPAFDTWAPFSQVESLSTVLFTPLGSQHIYKPETMERALHLMQQQHKRTNDNNTTDLALRLKESPTLPSSKELLAIEIPDTQAPLSLFQGFHASYPTYSSHGMISKHHVRRKKHVASDKRSGSVSDKGKGNSSLPRLQSQLVADKQKKQREYDKLQMNKLAISNQVSQIEAQIAELASRRKELEAKWAKLEIREMQIQDTIEDLEEAIVNYEEDHADEILKIEDRKAKRKEREQYDEELDADVQTGTCLKTLYGHEDSIICLDFDHAEGSLISSSYDASCRVWNLASQKCVGTLSGHSGIVRCLQVRENNHVYTGSDDFTIRHWDLSLIPPARSQSPSVMSTASSPSQSPRLDPQAHNDIVPSITECCIDTLEGHNGPVTAIFADEKHLVSGSADKTLKQWDLETGQCVMTLDVLWSSKGRTGIVDWGSIPQDDGNDGIYGESVGDFVGALQFWNFALASGTVDGKIRMWDLRTGQSHRTLTGHSGPITALQFDEVHVVSGSLDKSIKIWDLRTGSIFDMFAYEGPITSLQFDSNKIASTASTKQIKIYNRTSFQHTVIDGHTQAATCVRFRNNMIVSGGKDNVVKLWSL
ncbi:WD40-repeat-containing domain protein [Umbelopsis sp. PMI_123]|nr:WD40-repeat-containing domain protein [Umbelopsis sp. PMI_123]